MLNVHFLPERAWFLLPVLTLLSALAQGEAKEGSIDELLLWLSGDFDNAAQFKSQPPVEAGDTATFSHLGLQRRRVDAPQLGKYVIYAQINRQADPNDVYRQSVQVFSVAEDGSIQAKNYRFANPEAHGDILQTPGAFKALTPEDLVPALPEGCDPKWQFEDGTYVSRIDRQDCVMISRRDGKPRHIQATEFLSQSAIRNEESGYTADGAMIFGLPADQYYHYDRVTPLGSED